MEKFAYFLSSTICRHLPFSISPCATSDTRLLMGYCLIAAGIAGLITAFFFGANRPPGGR